MEKDPLLVQIINKAKQQQHENNNKTKDKPFVPLAKSTKLSTLVDYYIYKKDDDTSSIKSE